jgi:hypothetical protein
MYERKLTLLVVGVGDSLPCMHCSYKGNALVGTGVRGSPRPLMSPSLSLLIRTVQPDGPFNLKRFQCFRPEHEANSYHKLERVFQVFSFYVIFNSVHVSLLGTGLHQPEVAVPLRNVRRISVQNLSVAAVGSLAGCLAELLSLICCESNVTAIQNLGKT